jgi:hypothetical protein
VERELRCVVVWCNDMQGDDALSVQASKSVGKAIKKTFDLSVDAAIRSVRRPLTEEEKQKMDNIRVTVRVMKVKVKI